ncbi:MAG: hypothetical protein JO181_21725 [Solirubrobacterales bacterium]|nr:hypothetical protein [Solirubrobacterales bacterium]
MESSAYRFAVVLAAVVAGALAGTYGVQAHQSPLGTGTSATITRTARAFVSRWQPRAGENQIVLEQFSLRTGEPVADLERLPDWPVSVSDPGVSRDASLWMAVSTGPRYRSNAAGGDPAPDSCTGTVVRFNPARRATVTALRIPRSELVTDAVPRDDGRQLATLEGGCASSFFNQHIVIRDLRAHRRWSIAADAAPCHALSRPAWSPDGSELVFAYGASTLPPHSKYVPDTICTEPRPSDLAVVAAGRPTRISAWTLIPPSTGCSFQSAAFDSQGIVAIEGCSRGAPRPSAGDTDLGDAYLVQLDERGRVVRRLALKRGSDIGTVATDPRSGIVLVSENQAGNQGTATFDWVWIFDGHRLRVVGRYRGDASPAITAEPW